MIGLARSCGFLDPVVVEPGSASRARRLPRESVPLGSLREGRLGLVRWIEIGIEIETDMLVLPVVADGTDAADVIGQTRIVVVAGDPRVDEALCDDRIRGTAELIFVVE